MIRDWKVDRYAMGLSVTEEKKRALIETGSIMKLLGVVEEQTLWIVSQQRIQTRGI